MLLLLIALPLLADSPGTLPPPVDPRAIASPDGRYELYVDPTHLEGGTVTTSQDTAP